MRERNVIEIYRTGRFFGFERYFNRLASFARSSKSRKVNQFRVKVSKEGTVLRSGRMQVRRKSECLKESQREESAHTMRQKDREREKKRNVGEGEGENWMRHGSANAVCSFQATGLCNLFANPGYCGITGSWLRLSDARPLLGWSLSNRYFTWTGVSNIRR